MIRHVKRLLGIGTNVKPITEADVQPSERDPVIEQKTEVAKTQLYTALEKLEEQSINVRRLLLSETLDLVVRPMGKRGRK